MKISYPQLVKNIADAFRTATGSTEPIVVGELPNKVIEAIGSGGGDGTQKPLTVETGGKVILPVYANTEIEIKSNMTVETNVALESGE